MWRLKSRMRNIRDLKGTTLEMDEQKSNRLVRDLFGCNDEMEEEGTLDLVAYRQEEIDYMEDKVQRALMGTMNFSAPEPDGISYRLIKGVRNTPLVAYLIWQVALYLLKGTIPTKWKKMRVVLIPMWGRDLTLTKNWRLINLIN